LDNLFDAYRWVSTNMHEILIPKQKMFFQSSYNWRNIFDEKGTHSRFSPPSSIRNFFVKNFLTEFGFKMGNLIHEIRQTVQTVNRYWLVSQDPQMWGCKSSWVSINLRPDPLSAIVNTFLCVFEIIPLNRAKKKVKIWQIRKEICANRTPKF
jgi:hypothetical protein